MRYLIILSFLLLTACLDTDNQKQYRHYIQERNLVKICPHGEKIFKWNDDLYVNDSRQYPDMKVITTLDKVC